MTRQCGASWVLLFRYKKRKITYVKPVTVVIGVNRCVPLIVRAHGPEKQTSRFRSGVGQRRRGEVRSARIGQKHPLAGRLLEPKAEWLSHPAIETIEALD